MQAKGTTAVVLALLTGVLLGLAGSTLSLRPLGWRPLGERPFDRMSRMLALSDLQRRQLRGVLEDTGRELDQARTDYEVAQRRLMVKAYLRSRALLAPDQQARLDRKFAPPDLLREARAAARQEADETPAPLADPAPTPGAVPHTPVTSRSGA